MLIDLHYTSALTSVTFAPRGSYICQAMHFLKSRRGEVPVEIMESLDQLPLTKTPSDGMGPLALGLLVVLVILVLALVSIYSALSPHFPVKGTTNVPGPSDGRRWPILGDALRFARAKNVKEMLSIIEPLLNCSSKAVSVWIGPKLVLFSKDPHVCEIILTNAKSSDKDYDFYVPFNDISDGIISRNGKRWSDLRRPLDKLMTPKKMSDYSDVIATEVEKFCDLINEKCNQGVFDMQIAIMPWLLDLICCLFLGLPGHAEIPLIGPKTVKSVAEISVKKAFQLQYKVWWLYAFTEVRKQCDQLKEELSIAGRWCYDWRRNILAESGQSHTDPDFTPECYTDAVIKNPTNESLTGGHANRVMFDFVGAAYDTSAVAMSSACLFLAMHPEYQEKAYHEQMAVMGNSLRPPAESELGRMEYLWMVYQETLRHVGLPGVSRVLSAPIEIDGLIFPEGATVFVSLRGLHMHPDYWVKNTEFYPDNFLPEHVANRPRGAFMPFSFGARNCAGKLFAKVVALTVLSMLVRRYSFSTHLRFDEMEYKYLIMQESEKGYPIEVTRRPTMKATPSAQIHVLGNHENSA